MKRYTTINTSEKLSVIEVIEKPLSIHAPYVVDDSRFSPISEALANMSTNTLSDSQISESYDFVDGKDNGMELPIGRGRFNDITELSAEIKTTSENLQKDFNEFSADEKRKARQQKRLDMLKATKDVTQSTPSGN